MYNLPTMTEFEAFEPRQSVFLPMEDGSLYLANVGVDQKGNPLVGRQLVFNNLMEERRLASITLTQKLEKALLDGQVSLEVCHAVIDYIGAIGRNFSAFDSLIRNQINQDTSDHSLGA